MNLKNLKAVQGECGRCSGPDEKSTFPCYSVEGSQDFLLSVKVTRSTVKVAVIVNFSFSSPGTCFTNCIHIHTYIITLHFSSVSPGLTLHTLFPHLESLS